MARQNKDNRAVPEGRRKAPRILHSAEGGKAIADDKQARQLNLFTGTTENDMHVSPENSRGRKRNLSMRYKGSEPANKDSKDTLATMHRIVAQLDEALKSVASNNGAPGPNRQTVETVCQYWKDIKPVLTRELLEGTYRPGEIRRVWIPKPSGGERGLGIPDVIDRIVQEATRIVLEPLYEPHFHECSHGFRPKRSCQTAILQAKEYLAQGYQWVVDIDLKDYFNTVNHQRVMARLAIRVSDKQVLRLIGKMLKAKVVMPNGVVVNTEQGVPQGGPLSPLLSNIYLDELDWELQRRGHRFVRYADDGNIYVRSERAGQRVMAGIRQFIEKRMRLTVNEEKSAVARPEERHFLGFRLWCNPETEEVEVMLSKRTHERVRDKVRELTPRNFGGRLTRCISGINVYLKGWIGFFGICSEKETRTLQGIDAHIRRRLRAIRLKQWKSKRSIARSLIRNGGKRGSVMRTVYGKHHGFWALSHTPVVDKALPNSHWFGQGLLSLSELWLKATRSKGAPIQLCLNLA